MKSKVEKKPLLEDLAEFRKSLGTVVGERWWVQEYRPAYEESGYYGQWHSESTISNSKYFDSLEEAEKFLETVEPSRAEYRLRICHQTCYERLERRWI